MARRCSRNTIYIVDRTSLTEHAVAVTLPSPLGWHLRVSALPAGTAAASFDARGYGSPQLSKQLYGASALVLALGIFALDILTPLQGAVAVLYTIVVLLVSGAHNRTLMLVAGPFVGQSRVCRLLRQPLE